MRAIDKLALPYTLVGADLQFLIATSGSAEGPQNYFLPQLFGKSPRLVKPLVSRKHFAKGQFFTLPRLKTGESSERERGKKHFGRAPSSAARMGVKSPVDEAPLPITANRRSEISDRSRSASHEIIGHRRSFVVESAGVLHLRKLTNPRCFYFPSSFRETRNREVIEGCRGCATDYTSLA
jgi:hypothetical protein